ncbi:hypothetical protein TSAR_008457 [Trichomalopsis sarcophagae]|uniref:Uncharacterized protein n=1 Tax=Trichomalopsis sarcophagae TaxID=543379 RepID=A0A232FBM6_9HYME|nr:hypothetical protein TSAR_008457 [Trichomalopsis sarcophagae]
MDKHNMEKKKNNEDSKSIYINILPILDHSRKKKGTGVIVLTKKQIKIPNIKDTTTLIGDSNNKVLF